MSQVSQKGRLPVGHCKKCPTVKRPFWDKGGKIMIKVTLKDNSILEVEKGTTIIELAQKISEGLARMATCGIINGEVKDLRYELQEDCNVSIETFDSSLEIGRAHV